MAIVKDLILCALFICMFGVLLLFLELHSELRVSVIQKDVLVEAQVNVIEADLAQIREQAFTIRQLQNDIVELKEAILILQKRYSNARDDKDKLKKKAEVSECKVKTLKTIVTRLKAKELKTRKLLDAKDKEIRILNNRPNPARKINE